jgi:hypothetical protein
MNPITPADFLGALWLLPPLVAFLLVIACRRVISGYWAPAVRQARVVARLQDLQDHRDGLHLRATPKLIARIGGNNFYDADGRVIGGLKSPTARIPAHIRSCRDRAQRLATALDGNAPEQLVDDARRLVSHLNGVVESLEAVTR